MKWDSDRQRSSIDTLLIRSVIAVVILTLFVVGCTTPEESGGNVTFVHEMETTAIVSADPSVFPEPARTVINAETFPTPESIPAFKPDPPPSTPTPIPTSTQIPSPTSTATATVKPSPTIAGHCSDRIPSDDLLTLVTNEYAISADYVPRDLVSIANYLPTQVTRGYDTQLRRVAVPSMLQMIADMQRDGLAPEIISGYRSYSAQAIAWRMWLEREPDRASIISVPPGYSEHQLGTTIDFGSPELAAIVGGDDVEFHTYFYKTREGEWLENRAHEYGYTMSYPLEAFEITGFYYEPWHYRYIGVELASELKTMGISLTQHLLEIYPPPCD